MSAPPRTDPVSDAAARAGGPLRRPSRADAGRRGAVPLWLPVLAVVLLFAAGVRAMERRAQAEGFGWVDPAALVFEGLPEWADERWTDQLDELLRGSPVFRTDDLVQVARLEDALNDLPFVRRATIEAVLWPGGLEVQLELREPVACVPVGRLYYPVSDEGVILPGVWPRPPQVGQRFLPVLGPLEDAHGVFAGARPGDWLAEERHLDALAVVRSARACLPPEVAARLGRHTVEARDARRADPGHAGAVLALEGGRRIWFGRPPEDALLGVPGAPGELPAWAKWQAVERALALLEPHAAPDGPRGGWQVVDVRWDRPEIVLDPALLVALAEERREVLTLPAEPPRRAYEPPARARATAAPRAALDASPRRVR